MRRGSPLPFGSFTLRAIAPFACVALVACSSTSSSGASDAGASDATTDGSGVTDAHVDAGSLVDGGSEVIADGGVDGGPTLMFDAALTDVAGCTELNIGILGNPGANASSNFQTWLQAAGTTVQRIQTTAGVPLTAAVLAPFDVVVLDWLTRDYTTTEASVLAAWISAGGGLASMSGYDNDTTDDWHANSLLAPIGVAYSGPLLSGPVTSFAAHPITAGLTSITFDGGYAISDLGGTASTRTPIAFLPASGGSGTVTVGFAAQLGSGRAFVWGDEWIEFDSEWSKLPEIKQFWVQIFTWIAPTNKCAIVPPS